MISPHLSAFFEQKIGRFGPLFAELQSIRFTKNPDLGVRKVPRIQVFVKRMLCNSANNGLIRPIFCSKNALRYGDIILEAPVKKY